METNLEQIQTSKPKEKIPSVRLTRQLKWRISGGLKEIIPWKKDKELENMKVEFYSVLLEKLDKFYPVEDMNILKKYLNFLDSNMIINYINILDNDNSNQSYNLNLNLKIDRIIYGISNGMKVINLGYSFRGDISSEIGLGIYLDQIEKYDFELYSLSTNLRSMLREKEREVNEICGAYNHIIETSTTLGKLLEAVPELRDGIHKILNKYSCGNGKDEDETMKKILEFRNKNNINI